MAKKRLRFNKSRALSAYRKAIKKAADQLLEEFYNEISGKMNSSEGRSDLSRMSRNEEKIFVRMVIGQADAIMDSYGTGSKMDTHYNAALEAYKNSDLYNPARTDKTIVGRPKGTYTNIYGEQQQSSGKREGMPVEGFYKPVSPSYAFQRAEVWFFKGNRVSEVLTMYINEWIQGMGQYFDFR